jgi:sulfite reductase (ferredoxin)
MKNILLPKLELVHTLLIETEEKLDRAKANIEGGFYADSIYNSYAVFIGTAKALLTAKDVSTNTQHGVIGDFDRNYVETGEFVYKESFKALVLSINKNEPTAAFAESYYLEAKKFLNQAFELRKNVQIADVAGKVLEAI